MLSFPRTIRRARRHAIRGKSKPSRNVKVDMLIAEDAYHREVTVVQFTSIELVRKFAGCYHTERLGLGATHDCRVFLLLGSLCRCFALRSLGAEVGRHKVKKSPCFL